jgi:hypothetical protein
VALIDVERAILAVCFRAQPPAALLDALGDAPAWLAYRQMVRERLLREIRFALPRTCTLVGEAALGSAFSAYLEHAPPRTRYFRAIVGAFVASALPHWQLAASLPAACGDVARYELALWEVADLDASPGVLPCPLLEFAFDRPPQLSPALRLLAVSHAVHLSAGAGERDQPGEYRLCIHRASDQAKPRTWTLTRSTFTMLQRFAASDAGSVTEIVQRMAAEQGARLDASYVDALCATLAQFLEVGIVLGSR